MKQRKIETGHIFREWCLKNDKAFLLDEWDYERNFPSTPDSISYASNKDVWWKCPKGHNYKSRLANRVYLGRGCPFCSGNKVLTGENDFKTWCHQNDRLDLLEEWDADKNELSPEGVTPATSKKVWWICKEGHSWQAAIGSRTSRKRPAGCPYCSNPPKRILVGFNDFESWCLKNDRQDLLEEWNQEHNGNILPKDLTYGSGHKIWWKCHRGHEWCVSIASRTQGSGCPICSRTQTSFPEQAIAYYLSKAYTIKQRCRIQGFEIDILLSDFNVGIEYDGMFFHSSDSERELEKDIFYKNLGITVIHVKESKDKVGIEGNSIYFIPKRSNYLDDSFNDLLKTLASVLSERTGVVDNLSIDVVRDKFEIRSHYGSIIKSGSLESMFPELVPEWDVSKNHGLTSDHFSANSHEKVWWKCSKGHSWQADISSRSRGLGCPFCAGQRTIEGENDLATWCRENNPQLLDEWDSARNGFEPSEISKLSNKKVWWRCSNGHSWAASVANRVHGTGCPFCTKSSARGISLYDWCNNNDCTHLLQEWNYEKNKPLSPGIVTYGSHKKVWWRCENGHEWEAVIKSRTHDHGCPYCSPTYKKVLAGQNDLATWCKEKGMTLLLSEWDYEANGNLKPEMFTAGSHARIHWVCSKGHRWTAVIKERTKKNGNTCPFCKKKTVK